MSLFIFDNVLSQLVASASLREMCLDTLDYRNISITVFPERITFMMTVTTVEVADLDFDLTYEYECF